MSATAITTTIETLEIAHQRLQVSRTKEEAFFPEWCGELPPLDAAEQDALKVLRQRYLYQRSLGQLLEGAVTLLLASPLLAIAGFYDPPYEVSMEPTIRLILNDPQEVLEGHLNALVLKEELWAVVIESQKTSLSVWSALPPTLAYLVCNPEAPQPSFALMTNGDEIVFVKLDMEKDRQYAVSRVFSPFAAASELEQSLRVLKRLAQV